MKKHLLAIIISAILFVIPFFWFPPGFVDLGGDAGRLYFLEPFSISKNLLQEQNIFGSSIYAIIPYQIFLGIVKQFVLSPTLLIAIEHGLQLSLGFFFIYLTIRQMYTEVFKKPSWIESIAAVLCGVVYVGFITKTGWVTSLEIFNQVFLNPFIFYLLFRFFRTSNILYAAGILTLTLLYSENFGFSSMPQLLSFYPFALLFLIVFFLVVIKKPFPWKKLFILGLLYFGLHAFHFVPMIASILDTKGVGNAYIFSKIAQTNAGAQYFDENRQTLGKLSWGLFQPIKWNGQTILIAVIPVITFLGFLIKRNKLLVLLGLFFLVCFFLVSANITILGVKLYRQLFYIPGFLMFRSFDEKWYYVFSFFYTLLFGISFYLLFVTKRRFVVYGISLLVFLSVFVRIFPFLQGEQYKTTLYQSNTISPVFDIDPDLTTALSVVKTLPNDGNALTLPLTLPYFQVIKGKTSGAYVGVSLVRLIGGKDDYPGFWSFGQYQQPMIDALKNENISQTLQLLSLLNVKYIFRNTDPKALSDFPKYPYYKFDMTIDIPPINNQATYDDLLKSFPLKPIHKKGFFEILQLDNSVVRPTVYIPDIVYASQSGVLVNSSFTSAYLDDIACQQTYRCDNQLSIIPTVSFEKISPTSYSFQLNTREVIEPFILILSDDFHSSWDIKWNGVNIKPTMKHVTINGYANGWIIDPKTFPESGMYVGEINLGFRQYFFIGQLISGITVTIAITLGVVLYRKQYDNKKNASRI